MTDPVARMTEEATLDLKRITAEVAARTGCLSGRMILQCFS
jgi:hypothetical protein